VIGFFGLLEGAELALFLALFIGFIVLGILFYEWYGSREGMGKEPSPLRARDKKKGV
jgi:hypothetical protein